MTPATKVVDRAFATWDHSMTELESDCDLLQRVIDDLKKQAPANQSRNIIDLCLRHASFLSHVFGELLKEASYKSYTGCVRHIASISKRIPMMEGELRVVMKLTMDDGNRLATDGLGDETKAKGECDEFGDVD